MCYIDVLYEKYLNLQHTKFFSQSYFNIVANLWNNYFSWHTKKKQSCYLGSNFTMYTKWLDFRAIKNWYISIYTSLEKGKQIFCHFVRRQKELMTCDNDESLIQQCSDQWRRKWIWDHAWQVSMIVNHN